ncbi:hypothetical protein Hanom_Chr02g00168091 [Helianthus anomalus]
MLTDPKLVPNISIGQPLTRTHLLTELNRLTESNRVEPNIDPQNLNLNLDLTHIIPKPVHESNDLHNRRCRPTCLRWPHPSSATSIVTSPASSFSPEHHEKNNNHHHHLLKREM